jgi:hypothetical protein
MKPHRLILNLTLCLLCFANARASAALSDSQRACVQKAERHEKDGWIYLHIEGGPQERGFQYGYLLAKEISQSLRVRQSVWQYTSGMDWSWLIEKSKAMYTPKVDPESLAELGGMSDGLAAAGAVHSVDELIAYNGWFELAWYWWPAEKKKINSNSPNPSKQSCSSFIATGRMTADGGIVLGHNSMVGYPEADFNLVLDLVPEHGHRILMQTVPGWIHSGTDFFVTSAGLVGSETTIGGFDGFDEKGLPEFVRMRRATQDASGIDEWCNVMKKGNNGGYANAWLLGDVNSGEIARLELGLKHIGFEKKQDGFFTGSNIAENLKVLRFETDVNETDIRLSSIGRRVRWKKLMSEYEGKIDLEAAKRFESDHYDSQLGKENPGGRSLCGHFELDPQAWGAWPGAPFSPAGTFDGKVVDSKMAKQMSFAARWGSACGMAFDAAKFLGEHPQFDWMHDILKSRPVQSWTVFRAGEKE